MLKQMAWNTFKKTGNINTYMELMELENLEKNEKIDFKMQVGMNENGDFKNQRNYNCRKEF